MSTRFKGGPADGATLLLRAAPAFLRAVCEEGHCGSWDALDQPSDRPEAGEAIVAYRKVSDDGAAFIDYRDKRGRRAGMFCVSATYEFIDPQPDEAILRDNKLWAQWAADQAPRTPGGDCGDVR